MPPDPASGKALADSRSLHIGIVAGELSGDLLGAGLMRELRQLFPNARFEGIGGDRMLAEGMHSHYPLESLSVMGLLEVLRHLPRLLGIRRWLRRHFLADPPDLFIGIDAPDFNLGLERSLRAAGIPTVHYVSPTVWAWRQGRVRTIRRSVDLMLSIFPFEAEFFRRHDVPVTFVGHPLADEIPLQPDREAARNAMDLPPSPALITALLPGSRMSEVSLLGPVFLDTVEWLGARRDDIRFIVPCATPRIRVYLEGLLQEHAADLPVTLYDGRARDCMTAANAVLVASGTATLETLLHQRPMVVAYKVTPVTGWLARRLIKVPFIAMPNLIAGERLVDEFAQEQATVANLGPAMLALLDDRSQREELITRFRALHAMMKQDANRQAALAVARLLEQRG
ncbi:lipid-A-disaccharide synthase [Methylonatrum kenyense]|uniref:lipid-A-disaccharide synthase n=1 Tax=Methylonatrum kenyense TaxID=455253 RepID=UPI0020BDD58E|nr:lipid-A-disaccharide synthase [Methylonatrum kenyense]MCK8516385.1 lipid-A-disaccharide synthase [Methylonatrum kenyense]